MALVLKDRVKETCTGTSGDMALTGAVSGFVAFDADATFDSNTTYYTLEDADGTKWEVGIGTLSTDSTTLTRTTILANQVGFSDTTRQTFSGGTHTIFCGYPADKAVYLDANNILNASIVEISPHGTSAGNTGEIRLLELAANGTNYVGFKAPDAIGGSDSQIYILPAADGSNGQQLTTDGNGNLSWAASGSGGSGLTQEQVEDYVGGMVAGNTETGIAVTYEDGDGTLDFVVADTTVAGDSGTTGITPGDTLTIAGGTNVTTAMSGDTLTITATDTNTQLSQEQVEDFVGGMLGGTETLITVTYQDGTGDIDFVVDNDLSNYDNSSSGFITATLTEEQVEDFVGGMLGGTETGITVTYQDGTGDIDFVVADTTVAGDSGSTGITPGDTLTIAGGTNVTTAMSGDTLTITATDTNTQLTTEQVQDIAGGMFSSNTETLITATYQDADGTVDLVVDNDLSNYDNSSSGFITATLTEEQVEDFVGGMLGGTETGITVTYQDGTGDIDFVVADTTVAGDTGSTGMTPGDTLTIAGGTNVTTAMSGDTLTVTATDTNTQLSTEQVQDIAGPLVATGGTKTLITVTYEDGTGDMDFVVDNDLSNYDNSSSGFLTAHPNISAASSSDNSGRTYIQDITVDSNGHVTGIATATETVTDTNTMGSGFTVSATTDSNATTITQGDDLMFAAGTGITCETTADGTVTISCTVTDTNTEYTAGTLLDLSSTTFNVNLSEASAAVMAEADEFIFLDNDDSSAAKRESLSDLLNTIAGTVGTTGLDRSGATLVVSDLHPVGVSGSANQLLTDDGDGTVTSQSNFTFTGSAATLTGTLTVGVDDTGHDVKLFGATSGKYLLWDESHDRLTLVGNSVNEFHHANDSPKALSESNDDSGATISLDLKQSNLFNVVLTDSTNVSKIEFTNGTRGQKFILRITQVAGGETAATVAWNNVDSATDGTAATVRWPGGTVPVMSTSTGHTDVFGFICTDAAGTKFDGFIIGQDLPD